MANPLNLTYLLLSLYTTIALSTQGCGSRHESPRSLCPEVGLRALVQITTNSGKLLGAGYIDRNTGYIVTAKHVATGQAVFVQLAEATDVFPSHILLLDEEHDLAILKIDGDAQKMRGIPLTTSPVSPGDTVWGFGHPGSFVGSVSKGVVSATNRALDEAHTKVRYIQIDAATFEGSSGGPVLNESCQAIGVVARGTLRGLISFVVPSSDIEIALNKAESSLSVR